MRREARAQLRCELRRKRYAARHGAARRQRWVRGGPGTGRGGLPRSLGGCGARSPAVTAAGACRGRGRGGPTLGPGSEVGRGGWPRHGGLGPGPSACHCPSPPADLGFAGHSPRGQDRRPLPAAVSVLAGRPRARRQSEGVVSVSPLPWVAVCLWGKEIPFWTRNCNRISANSSAIEDLQLLPFLPSTCLRMTCPPTCRLASEPCPVGAPLAWPLGRTAEALPQGPWALCHLSLEEHSWRSGMGHFWAWFSPHTQGCWWSGHRCSSATLGWRQVCCGLLGYHPPGRR